MEIIGDGYSGEKQRRLWRMLLLNGRGKHPQTSVSLHLDKALTTVSEPAVPSEHLAEPLQMLGYPERWAAGLTRD